MFCLNYNFITKPFKVNTSLVAVSGGEVLAFAIGRHFDIELTAEFLTILRPYGIKDFLVH